MLFVFLMVLGTAVMTLLVNLMGDLFPGLSPFFDSPWVTGGAAGFGSYAAVKFTDLRAKRGYREFRSAPSKGMVLSASKGDKIIGIFWLVPLLWFLFELLNHLVETRFLDGALTTLFVISAVVGSLMARRIGESFSARIELDPNRMVYHFKGDQEVFDMDRIDALKGAMSVIRVHLPDGWRSLVNPGFSEINSKAVNLFADDYVRKGAETLEVEEEATS